MMQKTFQFDFRDLKLTVDQIENVVGYSERDSRELVRELISGLLDEAASLCDLKAEYRIFETISFDGAAKRADIDGTTFNIGRIIHGQIKNSDAAALFVCTAGERIGMKSRLAMLEKDLLEGYILDIIGSEAVETVADLMQYDLESFLAARSLHITNRFSPGYCGWNVEEQHKLFHVMADNFCGIKLTHSALMDPVKSVSGIIGIGSNVKRVPYTCHFCDLKDCIYRKKK